MLTKQNFYILLIIIFVYVLTTIIVRPTVPQSTQQKCKKEFVTHATLPDTRKIDIRVVAKDCLLNKHFFRLGEDIAKNVKDVPLMRRIDVIPLFLAERVTKENFMLIKQIWVRQSNTKQ